MANGNTIMPPSEEMMESIKELKKGFEADYIAKAKGVDGAAILAYFKEEVAKLMAGN